MLADCSRITSSYLPDYPAAVPGVSASGLKDNDYRSGDSITIIGWYKDMSQEMCDLSHEFEAGNQGIFKDSEKMYSAPIDSLGFFTRRMPVENTQMLFCDWRRSNIVLIAEPGEMPSIYALKRANEEGKIKLSDEDMAIVNKHTAAYQTFKKNMEEALDRLK